MSQIEKKQRVAIDALTSVIVLQEKRIKELEAERYDLHRRLADLFDILGLIDFVRADDPVPVWEGN